MNIVGIICEYNPFHPGHAWHIGATRRALGGECGVVCVMSGNFVQRGDFAVFNKHARAEMAVLGGADLVIEMPTPYALSSAEGFASAGVLLLDSLGICEFISFGSESGSIHELSAAADAIVSPEADTILRTWLDKGISYAAARQKAADAVLGVRSDVFKSPNNLLGIEYLKAMSARGSRLKPMTFKRVGGTHDSTEGLSARAIRERLLSGTAEPAPAAASSDMPTTSASGSNPDIVGRGLAPAAASSDMPPASASCAHDPCPTESVWEREIVAGRGPVSMRMCEQAMLSRLRALDDFSIFPGTSEGLDRRFLRYAKTEPTINGILEKVKTKRYAMSRLRRTLICACLGITTDYTREPPPYIRVLAMNQIGMKLLKAMRHKTTLPIITKPAAALNLSGFAVKLFRKESSATDFYALAYPTANARTGSQEWHKSPVVIMQHPLNYLFCGCQH